MPHTPRDLKLSKRINLTPDEAFAIVLRERRLELGLTQSDLEDDAKLDRSYSSKLELAMREVGLKAFIHLANRLELEPSEFMKAITDLLKKRKVR